MNNILFKETIWEYLEDKGVYHTLGISSPPKRYLRIESFYIKTFNKNMMLKVISPELHRIAKKLGFGLRVEQKDRVYLVTYAYQRDWVEYYKEKTDDGLSSRQKLSARRC